MQRFVKRTSAAATAWRKGARILMVPGILRVAFGRPKQRFGMVWSQMLLIFCESHFRSEKHDVFYQWTGIKTETLFSSKDPFGLRSSNLAPKISLQRTRRAIHFAVLLKQWHRLRAPLCIVNRHRPSELFGDFTTGNSTGRPFRCEKLTWLANH